MIANINELTELQAMLDGGYINAGYGATINEITPDMPQRFIAAFNAEYADLLAVLHERATSVEVKFGVLTWWS